jgi:hypothetical protein
MTPPQKCVVFGYQQRSVNVKRVEPADQQRKGVKSVSLAAVAIRDRDDIWSRIAKSSIFSRKNIQLKKNLLLYYCLQ